MTKRSRLITILGNLTAFGPFITDFYLPCLPKLTEHFSSSPSLIQTSLTAGMWGLAAGQLLIGPIADKFGRKRPLLYCLALFVASTIGCMFSSNISFFIFFRLLQGLTGSCGLVISKAIVADTFTGNDLSKYFALLAAVQGIAPIVAPVLGGWAFSLTSWQGAFCILALWGLFLIVICRKMTESLPSTERLKLPVWKTFQSYLSITRNRHYLLMNLLQGFAIATLMAYISVSPFIFQIHFGFTPMRYSIYFACNAIALVVGSAVVIKAKNLDRDTTIGTWGLLITVLLTSLALWLEWPFILFEVSLFFMLFCIGILTPVTVTSALNAVHENRGSASALLGALPYLLGGIVAPLTGLGNMIHSTVILIMLCAILSTLLWGLAQKGKPS